ncbi:hypothetical protein Hanom_Chr11g01031151 [Helianthus anomalus]
MVKAIRGLRLWKLGYQIQYRFQGESSAYLRAMMSLNWMASLSRVSDSSSHHAAAKMVLPEVSYTLRLFIPPRRFSTMSR